jgi:hypothetical protein
MYGFPAAGTVRPILAPGGKRIAGSIATMGGCFKKGTGGRFLVEEAKRKRGGFPAFFAFVVFFLK